MAITTTFHNWCDQLRSSFQEIEVNPSDEGATALMYACQQDNVGHLEIILKRKPEAIMERDRTLKSVLHYCVENVSLNCAQIVLNAAPELLDATDEDGYTALHLAVIAGNTLLVNYLVSKSADLNKLDFEGHSVIHWGTVCGKLELLQFLLKCGAEPSTPDVHGGYPIHYAAQMCGSPSEMGSGFRRSGLDVLNALLHHHVDVNVKDHDGRQPMLWAASAGSSDAVLALTNAGASIEARDKDGLTALHCAASRGHTECLETLIELCGADVDGVDDNGCTALFYSVTLGHADATQLLLRCGASPNHQDRRGRTAAHCGAAKGQFETLRILKQHNGNLWLRNIRGDYCLHEAVNAGRKDLVKWLLSQRPDAVDSSNIDDRCSLHIAAIANNIEMCKILLDYRSLINPVMKTHKGDLMTPLDAALLKSNRGCAKYLQLHGGVPSSKLTSFFAALRGPRRTESYSDYYGSPDCKLKAPLQNRSSRSLDTSPCGYRTTTSRKVQVRIEANLSAENIREYHAYDDLLKCTYKKNKLFNGNTSRNTSSYNADVVKVISYLSSDVESNLSDTCDYSLEKNYGERPRRRRRQRKRRPKRSEGNHGIYIDLPNVDTMHQAAEESGDVAVMTVPHRPMSELDGSVTTAKARAERDAAANQGHDWESIVQNRTKRTESSGNGFQEIQYQKLEAEGEEFDQGDFVPKGAELDNKTNDSIFWNGTIDGNNEDVDISVTALKEEGLNKQILGEESKLEYKNIEALAVESTDVIGKIVTKKVSQANYNGCIDDENVHFVVSAPLQKCKATYMGGLDDKTLNLSDTRDVCAYDNSATNSLIILPPSVSNRYDGCHDEANHKLTRTNQVAEDENLVIGNKNEVHVDSVDEFKNKKNINEIFDTEGKKELSLTTELDTDKGVICVIIDDDKTIGMEGEKDEARKKSGSERGVMKATHRRDQNSQETQSRFECSFQVLLDDDQEEQHTTLGLNDDPAFKSSTRHTPLTPIKGGKNKTRSRIPRSTSQVHKVKNELNDGNRDVNVVSVTQAVQYSLRKYHLERRIFHALLELKRLQIRAGKSNEQILVKRLIDDYQKAGFMVGLRQYDGIYSFRHFERYLYEQLRILQSVNKKDIPRIKSMEDFEMLTKTLRRTKAGKTLFESFPDNPLFCTHGTHRCIHATHAYTGIPCAAYISKINHHMIPKTDEGICRCFLPRINSKCIANDGPSRGTQKFLNHVDPSKPVTLELIHGAEKQVISLPTDKLDKNKRYFVSFTVEGVSNIDKKSPFIAQKTGVV